MKQGRFQMVGGGGLGPNDTHQFNSVIIQRTLQVHCYNATNIL